MILPNLLIVGAAKSGTTSLHNYLKQHPDIFMTDHKEPHFLINNEIGVNRIPNGISKYKDYLTLFKDAKNYQYRGESSAMYLQFPEISIKNIKKHLDDDVRIIIMLRNPIERAFSGYQHVKRYNMLEKLEFSEAIDVCENRYFTNTNCTPASRYLNIGLYYNMVKKFQENFGNRTHVIMYDDFIDDTQKELSNVFNFLDLKGISIDTNQKFMVGGWQWKSMFFKNLFTKKGWMSKFIRFIFPFNRLRRSLRRHLISLFSSPVEAMDNITKSKLQDFYYNDIISLSKLLDRNLKSWLQ